MKTKQLSAEEQMRKDYEEAKKRASGGGGKFWKPEEGDNVVRILPPWKPGENFYRKISGHYNVAQENPKLFIYCPRENAGEECPLCEQGQALFEKGGRENMKKAAEYRAKPQYISNVHIESTPSGDDEGEVRTFSYGVTIFTGLVDLMMGKWGNVYDALKGRAVCIKRSGSKKDDTDYNVLPEPDAKPVPKDVLNKSFNLDDNEGVVEVFTGDEIQELLDGASLDAIRAARDGGDKPAVKSSEKESSKPASKAAEGPGPIDKKLLKRIIGAAVEEEMELDAEEPEAIFAEFKEKIDGTKVKSLSKDTVALLKELGADVDGKVVTFAEAEASESESEGDDDAAIAAQMEKLRKNKKPSGKK